jgi:electron transfer flavoprotein beta subunit
VWATTDGFFVAKQLAEVIKNGEYDLVQEKNHYNGGMVPGMISGILGYNFINSCTSLTVDETAITAIREIDGGKDGLYFASINYWTKGLVEEKDLRIPNMRE